MEKAAVRSAPSARLSLAVAGVFALVFLVALGASRSLARPGGPGQVLDARAFAGDVAVAVAVLALAALAALVALLRPRRRRRGARPPEHAVSELAYAWWEKALLAALALLPLGALAAAIVYLAGRGGERRLRPVAPPGAAGPGGGVLASSPTAGAGPPVHWWILAALAAVLLAAAAIPLAWRRLRPPAAAPPPPAEARGLRAAIEESLDDLEREPDARRAVIRAYAGMERALAGHGMPRRPSEAPVEYLSRALGALRVSGPAGERLTALFARARFSEHRVGARMKEDAIAALGRVRDELAEPRP